MATLEEYISQATNAYQPARNAIQGQIDALGGRLQTATDEINKNYARQQDTLNRNRNMAAESASMQAAGSGGSFGGKANLANRAYYEKNFVPAQTQLQTNQANDLARAKQSNEDERVNLNAQLSNMEAQANQQATQRYWADVEQEKQRQWEAQQAELERQARAAEVQRQIDAEMAQWRSQMDMYRQMGSRSNSNSGGGLKNWDFGNGYSIQQTSNGQASYRYNGQPITAAQFMSGANHNWDLWNDVWNNGVKTQGVGSDTVDLFRKLSNNPYLSSMMTQDKSLSYLNNIRY